jgi:hypothetical protein
MYMVAMTIATTNLLLLKLNQLCHAQTTSLALSTLRLGSGLGSWLYQNTPTIVIDAPTALQTEYCMPMA